MKTNLQFFNKGEAMRKLIARAALAKGVDRRQIINMPLADFVTAATGGMAPRDSPARGLKTGDNDKSAADNPTESTPAALKPKRRGRRKADYETVKREAQLAADWERARGSRVYKSDFAKQNGKSVAKLDALLDRVAKRNARSDK